MISHAHDSAWFNSAPLPPLSAWETAKTCTRRWCALCQQYQALDPTTMPKYTEIGGTIYRDGHVVENSAEIADAIAILEKPITCVVEDGHGYTCGRETAQLCVDCGCGVCIPCNLPCFECAEPLHDHCRDEHAKSSGHRVDGPAGMPRLSQRPLTGTLIDELLAIGGAL